MGVRVWSGWAHGCQTLRKNRIADGPKAGILGELGRGENEGAGQTARGPMAKLHGTAEQAEKRETRFRRKRRKRSQVASRSNQAGHERRRARRRCATFGFGPSRRIALHRMASRGQLGCWGRSLMGKLRHLTSLLASPGLAWTFIPGAKHERQPRKSITAASDQQSRRRECEGLIWWESKRWGGVMVEASDDGEWGLWSGEGGEVWSRQTNKPGVQALLSFDGGTWWDPPPPPFFLPRTTTLHFSQAFLSLSAISPWTGAASRVGPWVALDCGGTRASNSTADTLDFCWALRRNKWARQDFLAVFLRLSKVLQVSRFLGQAEKK
ncbi:hypothetical protein IWZ00DRAFT_130822 [Phyllosticta capitalensis]